MAENTTQTSAPNAAPTVPAGTTIVVQKRSSAPMMFAFAILAIAGAAGAAWFVSQSKASGGENSRSAASPGQLVHLEGFTVNLADTEENHFVRVTMDLELDRLPTPLEKDKPASGLPMPRIRDTIIAILAASKAEPLLTPDGKIQLKKNLLDALNRRVPEMAVREIYFTEFLVQR